MTDYHYSTAIDFWNQTFTNECFMNCLTDPAFTQVVQQWKTSNKWDAENFWQFLYDIGNRWHIMTWFLKNDLQDDIGNYYYESVMKLDYHNWRRFCDIVEHLDKGGIYHVYGTTEEVDSVKHQDIIDAITDYLNDPNY